jgi:hypothetical protein
MVRSAVTRDERPEKANRIAPARALAQPGAIRQHHPRSVFAVEQAGDEQELLRTTVAPLSRRNVRVTFAGVALVLRKTGAGAAQVSVGGVASMRTIVPAGVSALLLDRDWRRTADGRRRR